MKREFVSYTPSELNASNAQNLLFEMAARCLAYGDRIIIEQGVNRGDQYLMVDFAPTDNSNAECEYDGEHVCWISSLSDTNEGKYFGSYSNYVEALADVAHIMLTDGFTEVYVESS